MKRALHFVLLMLVLLSAIEASAAAKKQSKHPKKQTSAAKVYQSQPGPAEGRSPRQKPERNRMGIKSLSDGELVAAPGPVSAGPPKEGSMPRAGSAQLDLRFLPQALPIRQERPEREAPVVKPVTIEGKVVPPNRNIAAPAPPQTLRRLRRQRVLAASISPPAHPNRSIQQATTSSGGTGRGGTMENRHKCPIF